MFALLSTSFVLLALQAGSILAQCPNVHVFGARETTAPPGYGTASVVVNLVLGAYSGSTSEAINYPACGGQSSCGSVSYANSVIQGVSAVASAVNSFNSKCPNTTLVLVGYSQVLSCLLFKPINVTDLPAIS
jgi:acetylxylan esterase